MQVSRRERSILQAGISVRPSGKQEHTARSRVLNTFLGTFVVPRLSLILSSPPIHSGWISSCCLWDVERSHVVV